MTIPDSDGLDNNNLIRLSSLSLPHHRFFLFFSNLSFNAVKFTERGNVDIRAETVREDDGQVFLRFEVLDTGVGIPQDRLGSIFESFTQADGSTTRRPHPDCR
ncbi:MAG: ATP-binding protein [Pseudomonadota bacterium]